MERYKEMKEELEELHLANVSKIDISNIIDAFQYEINSIRVACHIKDIKGIISILEARGTLHPENLLALETISEIVNRPFGRERINDFKRFLQFEILSNKDSHPEPIRETRCKLNLTDEVFEEVSQHLVKDWRMFARSLELKENEIHLIENRNQNKERAAKQVLEKFRDKNPKADHVSLVINALKSINRFQLVRKIEAIIASKAHSES